MKLTLPFFLVLIPIALLSQEVDTLLGQTVIPGHYAPQDYIYDQDLLSTEFHRGRRQALRDAMPDSSMAFLFANPIRNRSNDVDYEYHQDPNFYYLTGLIEPNAVLILFKEKQLVAGDSVSEVLFMQRRDSVKETWNGRRLGVAGGKEVLGVEKTMANDDFARFPLDYESIFRVLSIPIHDDIRDDPRDRGDLFSLVKHFRYKLELESHFVEEKGLQLLLAGLRQKKLPEELALMRKAIDFTCEAQVELMKSLHPGMAEYESEAIIEYYFKKNGAEHEGFPSILGGGENSCILHYNSNRKPLNGKDLLVCDVGAEYHGYTADVARTIPVDGTFSEEEAAIYDLVLKAQLAGIEAAKVGNRFWAPNVAAYRTIGTGLLRLGITKKWNELNIYFNHSASHYLGLDVHDAGLFSNLEAGNVITVEPGIYIPEGSDCDPKWWNIGVRIEDDILITTSGPEVLSSCVPKERAEIEALMQEQGHFDRINTH